MTTAPTFTLHRSDALATLADLPTASVDALVTDPPYSSGGMVRGDRSTSSAEKYGQAGRFAEFTGDNRDQRGYAYWSALWLGEALRVVRPGGLAFVFTDWRQLPATTDAIQAGGWVWRGIVPWHKPNARVFAGRITAACEYVVWASSGPLPNPLDGGRSFPGFYSVSSPRDREHAAQKPLEVMRGLIHATPEDATILDPFAGSGTTGVAAALEGRNFVGSELSEHYADLAERRIRAAYEQRAHNAPANQGDLFATV